MSNPTTPFRLRASSKVKENSTPRTSRAKSEPPQVGENFKTRRTVVMMSRPKSEELPLGSQKGRDVEENNVIGRSRNRSILEQFSRPRRQRPVENGSRKIEDIPDGKRKELEDKLEKSETLVKNLQSEVFGLKAELDKAQGLYLEMQSQNKKLTEDLAVAEAKIEALSTREQRESMGEHQSPKFKDIQKLIANKLERSVIRKESNNEASSAKASSSSFPSLPPVGNVTISTISAVKRKDPYLSTLSPPPPPPLPPRILPPAHSLAKATTTQKAPVVTEFYRSFRKQEGKNDTAGSRHLQKPTAISAHSRIVGEIQNRSAHLLAIKADIETKGEFINGLIEKVMSVTYTDIEDVLKFVDWLDEELSSLADEHAVLKHFKWPENKADAMREAAVEYRELKVLENEISSYKDDVDIPCMAALKRIADLLDKSERSIQRLIKLRNSVLSSYQEYKIPTDWMFESGIIRKIKQASMNLAKMYMKRVTLELKSVGNSDRDSCQESLLLQGVNFAYRAHKFAGGLDPEALCAFEEIRQRFLPGNPGGSRELLAGIPSS